jgi:hypothetical protein
MTRAEWSTAQAKSAPCPGGGASPSDHGLLHGRYAVVHRWACGRGASPSTRCRGAATRVVSRDGARAASAVCAEVHACNGSLCIGIARLRRQGRTGRRELAHTKRKRGPDMVALAAGLILITPCPHRRAGRRRAVGVLARRRRAAPSAVGAAQRGRGSAPVTTVSARPLRRQAGAPDPRANAGADRCRGRGGRWHLGGTARALGRPVRRRGGRVRDADGRGLPAGRRPGAEQRRSSGLLSCKWPLTRRNCIPASIMSAAHQRSAICPSRQCLTLLA